LAFKVIVIFFSFPGCSIDFFHSLRFSTIYFLTIFEKFQSRWDRTRITGTKRVGKKASKPSFDVAGNIAMPRQCPPTSGVRFLLINTKTPVASCGRLFKFTTKISPPRKPFIFSPAISRLTSRVAFKTAPSPRKTFIQEVQIRERLTGEDSFHYRLSSLSNPLHPNVF